MFGTMMRAIILLLIILSSVSQAQGQNVATDWYSESENNGIIIQNSFPKGGRYPGPTFTNFNYSYLVFFTRVVNETERPFHLNINFSADATAIPNSPDTFVKLFLPSDTMSFAKEHLFSYGITELESLEKPTNFQKIVNPSEDCLFYVVGIFYQTRQDEWRQERGGNRAELILKGQDLFYNMVPQIDLLPCGNITFNQ